VIWGIASSILHARVLTETGAPIPPVYGGEIQRSMKAVCHAAHRALRQRDEKAFDALALALEDVLNDDNSAALLLAAALPEGVKLETFTDFRFTGKGKPVFGWEPRGVAGCYSVDPEADHTKGRSGSGARVHWLPDVHRCRGSPQRSPIMVGRSSDALQLN
jgi:hypothetical protein